MTDSIESALERPQLEFRTVSGPIKMLFPKSFPPPEGWPTALCVCALLQDIAPLINEALRNPRKRASTKSRSDGCDQATQSGLAVCV